MRVLLLHPEGSPFDGGCAREHWDLIVDLGYAGADTYADWGRRLNAEVISIHHAVNGMESYRWVNEIFDRGRGKILDRMGLDWWEFMATQSYENLHVLYLCQRVRSTLLPIGVELAASHPHPLVRIAEQVFNQPVRYLNALNPGAIARVVRGLQSARNLRAAQVAEIGFDKWDPRYALRRHWSAKKRATLKDSAVLLPSAYSNVTRAVNAYAAQLPQRKFLLVTTRRSAEAKDLPSNVVMAPLAAYAVPDRIEHEEMAELKQAWGTFVASMQEQQEFRCALNSGLWDYFPAHLEQGLHLREAWRHLLDSEPISGVLCGDDLNFHTRLPLALAAGSNRSAVYCSHGALDGGFLFKKPFAHRYLVKGEMESDYLRRIAHIQPENILKAGPGRRVHITGDRLPAEAIVFFSQPFEVLNGRTDCIYREILPPLCNAAARTGRKVILKLHPFESKRGRRELVNSFLPENLRDILEIVDGTPPEAVMARAWCGITVDSSVAVECALRNIPFFLCGWLDFTGMGYLQQYARFGVARVLSSPEQISRIPEMTNEYRSNPSVAERLWQEADPTELDEMIFGPRPTHVNRCAC